jgi:tryptophanyl-tRNA synthetase
VLDEMLAPLRERRIYYEERPALLHDIIETGAEQARKEATKTLELVKSAMNVSLKI